MFVEYLFFEYSVFESLSWWCALSRAGLLTVIASCWPNISACLKDKWWTTGSAEQDGPLFWDPPHSFPFQHFVLHQESPWHLLCRSADKGGWKAVPWWMKEPGRSMDFPKISSPICPNSKTGLVVTRVLVPLKARHLFWESLRLEKTLLNHHSFGAACVLGWGGGWQTSALLWWSHLLRHMLLPSATVEWWFHAPMAFV